MSIGQAIKGIHRGFQEAGQSIRAIKEDERRDAAAKREEERFAIEKKRAERENQQAEAAAARQKEFEQLETEWQNGTGAFADLVDPERKAAMPQEQTSAIPDPNNPQSVAQRDPVVKALNPRVEGQYRDPNAAWNTYYNQLGSLMRRQFVANGDYARAAMVESEIEKLRESKYGPVRNAAMAAVVGGADGPTVEPLLSRAYGTLNDGRSIKEGSVQFDPKTKKYSMVVVDKDGKEYKQAYGQMDLAGVLGMASPLKVMEWNVGRADKEREFSLEEKKVRASETTAAASLIRAKADKTSSDALLKGADQKARVEALRSFFPNAEKQLKPEEQMTMKKDDLDAFNARQSEERRLLAGAEKLSSLNPTVDVRAIVEAARQGGRSGGFDIAGSENGRQFTIIGSQRIYLN